jgi:hypothetical protein
VFSNKTVSDDVNKINIGKPVNKNEEKIICEVYGAFL